jgi:signal transduction histidine kinase
MCRLMDILLNLVSNAFKFTSEGHVTVTVIPAPSDSEHRALQFSVRGEIMLFGG